MVVPIAGFADYGLCRGLDAEEAVLMSVLKRASVLRKPGLKLLVLPPIRFALGPKPICAFPIDPDVACELLEEVASWVGAAGFSKILLFNASPWNEEVTKAVGRDLRISKKLQMYCVQLSALGLDFDPVRGGDRTRLKSLIAALTADGEHVEGSAVLEETASRLSSMLAEMRDHPPLPNGGEIPTKRWP